MQTGCFYFKRTASGNLLGEFSDNEGDGIYAECADVSPTKTGEKSEKDDAGFVGTYLSVWRQGRNGHEATLNITRNPKNSRLYKLIWVEQAYVYSGHGMLCEGMLIGNYTITKKA